MWNTQWVHGVLTARIKGDIMKIKPKYNIGDEVHVSKDTLSCGLKIYKTIVSGIYVRDTIPTYFVTPDCGHNWISEENVLGNRKEDVITFINQYYDKQQKNIETLRNKALKAFKDSE
jgi:hypothetical protein